MLPWYQNGLQSTDRVKLLRREIKKTQGSLELVRIRCVFELWPLTNVQVWFCLETPSPDLKNGFLKNILMTRSVREVILALHLLLSLRRFDAQNAMPKKSAL